VINVPDRIISYIVSLRPSRLYSETFDSIMPKARTSFVWAYLSDVTKKPAVSSERVTKCKLCPYMYKSKTTTTTAMVNHLRSAHKIVAETSGSDTETESTSTRHLVILARS
jgi:hypothetical protein